MEAVKEQNAISAAFLLNCAEGLAQQLPMMKQDRERAEKIVADITLEIVETENKIKAYQATANELLTS